MGKIGFAYLAFVFVFAAGLLAYNWQRTIVVAFGYSPLTCQAKDTCNGLMEIDCGRALGGPYYYVRMRTGKVLGTCGLTCEDGCASCPPKEWACHQAPAVPPAAPAPVAANEALMELRKNSKVAPREIPKDLIEDDEMSVKAGHEAQSAHGSQEGGGISQD